jgi:purine-binding chemotaxis protein CheW
MVVDSVSEVLRIPSSTVEPPPAIAAGVDQHYISGVVKLEGRLLLFLDISRIATDVHTDIGKTELAAV